MWNKQAAWETSQNNQIYKVERVQLNAVRFVLSHYDPLARLAQMQHQMKCQHYKHEGSLVMLYTVVYYHITFPLSDYVTLKSRKPSE